MKHTVYFETLKIHGATVVKPVGRLDESSSTALFKSLNALAERHEPRVELDLSRVSLLTSAAARAISQVAHTHADVLQLYVVAASEPVIALLQACGLSLLPNIHFHQSGGPA